jgi:hypothetical protein
LFVLPRALQVIRQQKQMRSGGSVPQEHPALGEAVVHFQVRFTLSAVTSHVYGSLLQPNTHLSALWQPG